MAPAVPCKTSKNIQHVVTSGKTNEFKSKFACILEASESTRLRMGESLSNHHEDHIAGNVNTIHPAPEIHEHFTIQTGYGTLCISSCTISTILRQL